MGGNAFTTALHQRARDKRPTMLRGLTQTSGRNGITTTSMAGGTPYAIIVLRTGSTCAVPSSQSLYYHDDEEDDDRDGHGHEHASAQDKGKKTDEQNHQADGEEYPQTPEETVHRVPLISGSQRRRWCCRRVAFHAPLLERCESAGERPAGRSRSACRSAGSSGERRRPARNAP